MIPIGCDPGSRSCKTACVTADGVHVAIAHDTMSLGEVDPDLLPLGQLQEQWYQPHQVHYANATYLVGPDLGRFSRSSWEEKDPLLLDPPKLRAAFYDTTFQLLGPGQHEIAVLVGVPGPAMASSSTAQAALRQLRSWLLGRHRFQVNDTSMQLEVTDVRIMDQSAGTYWAWGLDNQGQWARPLADLEVAVGICDIGYRAIHLLTLANGDVTARVSSGDELGVGAACSLFYTKARGLYDLRFTAAAADMFLRQPWPRFAIGEGAEVDVNAAVAAALSLLADYVLLFLRQHWGTGRQFRHLLFTGGGAALLRPALLRQYPHATLLPNPSTANAVGLARLARRIFQESNGATWSQLLAG